MSQEEKEIDERRPVHYRAFLASLERLAEISQEDLAIIRVKPRVADDPAADARWRAVCKRYGILTSAECNSRDQEGYYQLRRARTRIATLKAEIDKLMSVQADSVNKQVLRSDSVSLDEFRLVVLDFAQALVGEERKRIVKQLDKLQPSRCRNILMTVLTGLGLK